LLVLDVNLLVPVNFNLVLDVNCNVLVLVPDTICNWMVL